jgi:DNA-binding NtrC family response regulator
MCGFVAAAAEPAPAIRIVARGGVLLMEQSGDRSVLLVEDEVLVRLSIADELRQADLNVLEAANADEAATVLQSRGDTIGVVLTDIQMPGSMDGIALMRFVRERYPAISVVVLSGAHADMLRDVKADALFTKPHHPERLIDCLKQLLRGRAGNGSANNNARRK